VKLGIPQMPSDNYLHTFGLEELKENHHVAVPLEDLVEHAETRVSFNEHPPLSTTSFFTRSLGILFYSQVAQDCWLLPQYPEQVDNQTTF
jgi:hypothetical protein